MNIKKYTPSADKRVLVLLAGTMWCGVGVMLFRLAVTWLLPLPRGESGLMYVIGFMAAMAIHHFGFLHIADKNLRRLLPLTEKRCVFSFMTWRSYLIVLVMVTLGITLRHSSFPKQYLSVLYIGIGLALFLSGIRYIRFFIQLIVNRSA